MPRNMPFRSVPFRGIMQTTFGSIVVLGVSVISYDACSIPGAPPSSNQK